MTTKERHPRLDLEDRTPVARGRRFPRRRKTRTVLVCATLAAATLAVAVLAVTTGDFELSLLDVWAALVDPDAGFARTVVLEWRLPRAVAAIVFGAALAVSGAIFQSLTRNPLASPDIIGFSTGSYTGALLVMTLVGGGYFAVGAGAIAGGIVTATIVYLLAWRRSGTQGFRLLIVGIAVAAVLGSFNTWLLLTANLDVALNAAVWGAGTLNGITGTQVTLGSTCIFVILGSLSALAPGLRQLELGDDLARATGTRVETARLLAIGAGVVLIATVTAAAGPIAFIALAAPQIAKRLAQSAGVPLLPSAFVGALLLTTADFAAQHLLPDPLPVGVVTVIIGGGYLIYLIIHEARRRP
ncbi:FecCD family ABC transporter permease [Brachybacterium sp. AOP42-E1-35]|uniref:FecCD family ABC transporter permease n=1 Tax=Brachybacterium sp. AOP42-E1-35 TaxID=3457664 RepID=UPI00402A7E74